MKLRTFIFSLLMFLPFRSAFGQEVAADPDGYDFITVIVDKAYVGLIPWIGIFLCALLVFALGIVSVLQARKSLVQWPLATKILFLLSAWALVLGLTGFAQGALFSYLYLQIISAGAAQAAMLSCNLAQSLYPIAASLVIALLGLLFLMCSALVRHRALMNIASKLNPRDFNPGTC